MPFRRTLAAAAATALLAGAAAAEVPAVVADIPATHSLVAQVLQGVGAPVLLTESGASPHGHALRPSEAASLQAAELVVWVGRDLSPWLGRAIDSLAADAASLSLLEVPRTTVLERREDPAFRGHHSDEHDHGAADPHAWLDPENARVWLDAIAEALSQADPANAGTYRQNARDARAELDVLIERTERRLAPIEGRPFVVSHDAFHYFEGRFDVPAVGAVSATDAAAPGPSRLQAVRDLVAETGATCLLAEPGFDLRLADVVAAGGDVAVVVADPVGVDLAPGPQLYAELIDGIASALAACLDEA